MPARRTALALALLLSAAAVAGEDRLAADARAILPRLESYLGRPFPREVAIRVISRAEVRPLLEAEVDVEMPPEEIRFQQSAWIRLGLLPAGYDLRREVLALLEEQIAGFYSTTHRALYLLRAQPFQDMLAAHELTHAFQDQLHDLDALQDERKHDEDRATALLALVEGEATLTMQAVGLRRDRKWQLLADAVAQAALAPFQSARLDAAPLFLRESLVFPYERGSMFLVTGSVRGGAREGTPEAVRRLFADIPESTEQILHPEKYFGTRDRPTRVVLDGLAQAAGAGWSVAGEQTLGEHAIGLLLRSHGLPAAEAEAAATGWDGDRFALLENAGAQALVWVSAWDDATSARRFARRIAAALERRFAAAPATPTPARREWTLPDGRRLCLARTEREVLLLDGFPAEVELSLRRHLSERNAAGTLFSPDRRDEAEAEAELEPKRD